MKYFTYSVVMVVELTGEFQYNKSKYRYTVGPISLVDDGH